ncbi:MAG: glycosyltransferase family 4 protein [Candidatus Nitricoxidivorans perseverans]|uniref:Glycosyltransferase family 4 protein n=1 Tax=Candidatus Nitricoxidivorans perseverans TaxID=2975601 RepID=A0AA49ITA7_9PROT|nr:MAG: glycosyltransferase family 4 protein [Candidatus Nitricoxidivorans perseverans]
MKLAIVRQKYTPYGGAERFVERALSGLRAQGAEVTVIAREWTGNPAGILKVDPFYLGRTWRDVGFSHRVRRIIRESRFDLVQSHERIPGCHVYRAGDGVHATWLELRGRGAGLSPWHRYVLKAEAEMFLHPSLRAVICNSRMVRDDIARRFGLPDEKLHVIHNGVDLDAFHPGLRDAHRRRVRADLGIPPDAPVILFVGSGFERKGVSTLLRALVGAPAAHLVVVGKDRHLNVAEKLAQTLGVDDRARFLGGREDVRPYYGAADFFCLPSLYDPMPNAALEAMACGLPVIASSTCGAAELIEEGRNGFVCDALDVATLARRMDALCDRKVAMDMGLVARHAVGRLDFATMSQAMTDLYRKLLNP